MTAISRWIIFTIVTAAVCSEKPFQRCPARCPPRKLCKKVDPTKCIFGISMDPCNCCPACLMGPGQKCGTIYGQQRCAESMICEGEKLIVGHYKAGVCAIDKMNSAPLRRSKRQTVTANTAPTTSLTPRQQAKLARQKKAEEIRQQRQIKSWRLKQNLVNLRQKAAARKAAARNAAASPAAAANATTSGDVRANRQLEAAKLAIAFRKKARQMHKDLAVKIANARAGIKATNATAPTQPTNTTTPTVLPVNATVPPTTPVVPPTDATVPPATPIVPPTDATVPPATPIVPPTDATVPAPTPNNPPANGTIPPVENVTKPKTKTSTPGKFTKRPINAVV